MKLSDKLPNLFSSQAIRHVQAHAKLSLCLSVWVHLLINGQHPMPCMNRMQAVTLVSSRAITQRRPDPSTDVMSASLAARP